MKALYKTIYNIVKHSLIVSISLIVLTGFGTACREAPKSPDLSPAARQLAVEVAALDANSQRAAYHLYRAAGGLAKASLSDTPTETTGSGGVVGSLESALPFLDEAARGNTLELIRQLKSPGGSPEADSLFATIVRAFFGDSVMARFILARLDASATDTSGIELRWQQNRMGGFEGLTVVGRR